MKKTLLFAAGAVLVAAAVSIFVYVNNGKEDLLKENVAALAATPPPPPGDGDDEGEGDPKIPCVKASSTCFYTAIDADGISRIVSTPGMTRK